MNPLFLLTLLFLATTRVALATPYSLIQGYNGGSCPALGSLCQGCIIQNPDKICTSFASQSAPPLTFGGTEYNSMVPDCLNNVAVVYTDTLCASNPFNISEGACGTWSGGTVQLTPGCYSSGGAPYTPSPISSATPSPTNSPTTKTVVAMCTPFPSTKKSQCKTKTKLCGKQNIRMKWAGRGSRVAGVALADGGCQCDGYCGYLTPRPCKADRQCKWNTTDNSCHVRATGLRGGPISPCKPPA